MIALKGRYLFDGADGELVENGVVLVDGDRISAAGPVGSAAIPPQVDVIELDEHTVLPGLIDAYTHLRQVGETLIYPGEFPGWDLEHAATTETSLMLALDPASVRHARVLDERMDHVPPYAVFPQPRNLIPPSGVMSKATPASRELGDALLETVMLGLGDLFEREFH